MKCLRWIIYRTLLDSHELELSISSLPCPTATPTMVTSMPFQIPNTETANAPTSNAQRTAAGRQK